MGYIILLGVVAWILAPLLAEPSEEENRPRPERRVLKRFAVVFAICFVTVGGFYGLLLLAFSGCHN